MNITARMSTERILRELNVAKSAMTLPLVFATLSSVALAATWAMYQEPSLFWKRLAMIAFWPDIASLLVSTFVFNEAWWHYRTVKQFEPKEAPPRVADDLLNYNNQAPARALETRPRDNLLLLTRYKFKSHEWRRLVYELRASNKHWTRDALKRSDLFVNITAPNVFNEITTEFARAGIVTGGKYKWRVTDDGWHDLCEKANMPVVI